MMMFGIQWEMIPLMMAECVTNIGCDESKTFEFSILDAICFHGRQDLLFLAKDPSLKTAEFKLEK